MLNEIAELNREIAALQENAAPSDAHSQAAPEALAGVASVIRSSSERPMAETDGSMKESLRSFAREFLPGKEEEFERFYRKRLEALEKSLEGPASIIKLNDISTKSEARIYALFQTANHFLGDTLTTGLQLPQKQLFDDAVESELGSGYSVVWPEYGKIANQMTNIVIQRPGKNITGDGIALIKQPGVNDSAGRIVMRPVVITD